MTAPKLGTGYAIRFAAADGDRPVAPRHELPIPVTIVHEGVVTRGVAKNISASGIWVRDVSSVPPIDACVRVNVLLDGCTAPSLRVTAAVVRHIGDGGFAARFVSLDPAAEAALHAVLNGLAQQTRTDDDETVVTWSSHVLARLSPDLRSLLNCIATNEGRDTRELIRECAHRGLIRFRQ